LTVLNSFLRQSFSVSTNVTSALEVFLNDMRYINSRFTYLLTNSMPPKNTKLIAINPSANHQGRARDVKARDRDVGASRDRLETETSRPRPHLCKLPCRSKQHRPTHTYPGGASLSVDNADIKRKFYVACNSVLGRCKCR